MKLTALLQPIADGDRSRRDNDFASRFRVGIRVLNTSYPARNSEPRNTDSEPRAAMALANPGMASAPTPLISSAREGVAVVNASPNFSRANRLVEVCTTNVARLTIA